MVSSPIPYWRLSSLYFFYFATVGVMFPYWGPYLNSLGYDASSIGLLAAIPMATKIIAPNLWSWLADKTGSLFFLIRLGAVLAAVGSVGIIFNSDIVALAIALFIFSFFWNAILPQFEVVTLDYLGVKAKYYSRIRVWGSIGFIVAVVFLGWYFETFSLSSLPWILLLILLSVCAACFLLPRHTLNHQEQENLSLRSIFMAPSIVYFFLVVFFLQISHGVYYGFYSIFMESYGYSKIEVGLLWAVGVVAEIVLFYKCHTVLHAISLRNCLLFSLVAAILRWFMIAFLPDWWLFAILAQLTHALTFGMVHAVSMEVMREHFGKKFQAQGQAFYSAFSLGAGTALGTLMAGFLWSYSPVIVFVFAAAMSLCAWLLALAKFK